MKKRLIGIAIVLAVALVISGIVLHRSIDEFWSTGIHTLGKYGHFNLQKDCYIFTHESGKAQISGKSVFSINGVTRPFTEKDGFGFTGHMEVDAYPIAMKDSSGSFTADFLTNTIRINNQGVEWLYPECDIWYLVVLSKSDPGIVAIEVFNNEGNVATVISADSEEEAMENYDYYISYMQMDKKG